MTRASTMFRAVALIAVALVSGLYFTMELGGDLDFVVPHLFLNKIHLWHELSFPYFTPAMCGGFFLGADPQNPLFTILQPFGLLLTNQYLAIKLAMAFAMLIFGLGYYRWLETLGVRDRLARLLASALVSCSGYFVAHYHAGHVTFHSLVYLPWLFVEVEKLFEQGKPTAAFLAKRALVTTLLLFLLLNASPHWFPFAFLYLLSRLLVALVGRKPATGSRAKRIALVLAIGLGASLLVAALSAVRLTAIYAFALKPFPRDVPITQIINSTRDLLWVVGRALFDARVITSHLSESHLGSWWEWSAFLGLSTLPLIAAGVFRVSALLRSPAFLALGVAAFLQLIFCRYDSVVEVYRQLIPPARSMTYYYRGVILVVFLCGVLLARGFELLIVSARARLALAVAGVAAVELLVAYGRGGILSVGGSPSALKTTSYSIPVEVTEYSPREDTRNLIGLISEGKPTLHCYNPILGYDGSGYRTQVKAGPALPNNCNGLEVMFAGDAPSGTYQSKAWPLWPRSDSARLSEFLRFKQVVELPPLVRWGRWISLIAFLVLVALIGVYFSNAKSAPNRRA